MNLLSMLGGNAFVMFNKELAHDVSVNGTMIFGQLCSSYESFGSKNMLTIKDRKEYYFLTSEVIEEETALTYKQQSKAIKDLEEAGYIETVIMGQPAKKYFHITDKIFEKFKVSSDKKKNLNEDTEQETPDTEQETPDTEPSDDFSSNDKKENQAFTKGESLDLPFGSSYKEIKEKELSEENNNYFGNKEQGNKNQEIIDKLILEYMKKGMSKEL